MRTHLACAALAASALALAAAHAPTPARAQEAGACAAGKTIEDGTLTIATGNPAYAPWVEDDAPESGRGFEAAVAYAVAERMGFARDAVAWTRTSFDEAIQPGAKDFDLNIQQFSITPERDRVVDFSAPYYDAAMAVLVRRGTADGVEPTMEAMKGLKWGAVASTTALPVVMDMIEPESDPLLYDDTANVAEAMKANQIDAAIFDLPTALYISAVVLEDGVVLGQFASGEAQGLDRFGMLMGEGSALKPCVDEAIAALKEDGTLEAIEAEWLREATGAPLIE